MADAVAPPPGTDGDPPVTRVASGEPRWLGRIGLAIVHPRWALTVAGDRRNAGRSGSDLLLAIVLLLMATRARAVIGAVWLGSAVDWGLGARAFVNVLTRTLTVDLGFLVIGATLLWASSGKRRDLGRAFDLACVAALPLVYVDLVASTLVQSLAIDVPMGLMWLLSGIAYGWTGTLVAFAIPEGRRSDGHRAALPPETARSRQRGGLLVVAIMLVGIVVQLTAIGRDVALVRPMTSGAPAPPFALPRIEPRGDLGPKVSIAPGTITVVDFWATWCSPCLAAMPRLDALARAHPELVVLAVNLDDPVAARALFDERRYTMTLVSDDNLTSERYGVSTIPHTVVIDRTGVVRLVARGRAVDLEREITRLSAPGATPP